MVVALVMLGGGLLALVAASRTILGQLRDGASMNVAAGVARSVVDSLRSRPCSVLVSGSESTRNTRVIWTVAPVARARSIDVEARHPFQRRQLSVTSRTIIACPPP